MKLAVLFWFYKEVEICENRLKLLKQTNPDLQIFGLYGGKEKEAESYRKTLGKYLDDFYTTSLTDKDGNWKWHNGDLLILDWYDKKGRDLDWDSVAVVQWDMLIFDSLVKQFQGIREGEIFLSGLKSFDEEIERKWTWITDESGEKVPNYLGFLKYIKDNYGYDEDPLCCLFILQVFPKTFFEKYLAVKNKELGFLEYKIPTYARIFGIPFYKKDLGVGWFNEREPLNADAAEIGGNYIKEQLSKEDGWRIFHPYYKKWEL